MKMKKTELKLANGDNAVIVDTDKIKMLKSENYNFLFNKADGFFARWGKTEEDDGDLRLGLPEIADIEIAEVCEGVPGIGPCNFCYKQNSGNKGQNMSLDTFKKIFHKLPASIGQIAFGCGTLRRHPEMWDIFRYTKDNGVTPNLTINGDVDDHEFDKIVELCGACAVSIYDKELSYNAIDELTNKRNMKQVNIHFMISQETYDKAFEIMNDVKNDHRLERLNALVFLTLKPKGRSKNRYHNLTQEQFTNITNYALEHRIPMGFDSCSAQLFMKAVKDHPNKKQFEQSADPCESTLYSMYVDVRGNFYPCSFSEGVGDWQKGISVLDCDDFIKDVWFNEKTRRFSDGVIACRSCGKSCSIYDLD